MSEKRELKESLGKLPVGSMFAIIYDITDEVEISVLFVLWLGIRMSFLHSAIRIYADSAGRHVGTL